MADELSEPLPANNELRHDTEIDDGIHSFAASGVAPAAIQEFAQDLAAAAPAVQQAALIRTDARKAELHRAAKNSSEWMVQPPLVKDKVQKRQRLGRKPKKMTAPQWQRHATQKVAAVAANKAAARARTAALAEVQVLERIPVSTRMYAMKEFESLPKYFQNHQMLLKAFWHKLKFPAIAYTELIKLYPACSTRQNLQKHLDTVARSTPSHSSFSSWTLKMDRLRFSCFSGPTPGYSRAHLIRRVLPHPFHCGLSFLYSSIK